ncbi:hypothetical protein MP228_011641 [Amoeboaphelidium protococcarum]|nr:hypothetical protein MP228_011641 [Amoeboaphelidium protococcarum]
MQVLELQTLARNESERWWDLSRVHHRPIWIFNERFESKHICWDPKDGELCLNRVKPEETLVEARSGTDVQIVRQIWVQGRKTNRTIQQLVPSEVSLRIAETVTQLDQVKRMIRGLGELNFLNLFSNFKQSQVGHFWQAELAMRDEPNVELRCRNTRSFRSHKSCRYIQTAGRWSWKLKSAKECVTTHLPNVPTLKMDGAQACYPYSTVKGSTFDEQEGVKVVKKSRL